MVALVRPEIPIAVDPGQVAGRIFRQLHCAGPKACFLAGSRRRRPGLHHRCIQKCRVNGLGPQRRALAMAIYCGSSSIHRH